MNPAPWPWPRVFAHRCGGRLAPENTVPALEVAARFGVGVEFDVMLSADGTPHLIHDETLERTTSGYGRVAETGDAALARLDASAGFAGFHDVRIPRLLEAARRCRELHLGVNIEIKPSRGCDPRSGETVARLVQRCWHDDLPPPLLSSFSEPALAAAARAVPQLLRGLLVEAVPDDWQARCARLGVIALHADAAKITPTQIRAIRNAGLRLVLYTEDDPTRAARLFELGVDAIITDRPDLVRPPGARP
ncbi:MAG: glycerophosphodiester phosphodiesterase [Zoogloeaceae bacterium]|nr:glycerophosphodiester phosphodiesterase [Zoogloeaceae bacterium]